MKENIQKIITDDGSIGLYDKNLDEIFHSKFGAKTEAFEKFVEPCLFMKNSQIDILDICYGIGYNTKTALKYFENIKTIDCVEIDQELILESFKFDFDIDVNKIIEENIKTPDFIRFFACDIREIIKKLNKKYDIIFHDGFAPHKQSELWSEDLILEITKLMKSNSIYVTYNHSKPVLNALFKAGLSVGKTIKNNKTIGTVASFDEKLIKNPLDSFEIGQLNTKSAITYKDKHLNLSHGEILQNREIEVQNSKLISLSKYLKEN